MDVDITTSPNEICFISKYKFKTMEVKVICPIIGDILKNDEKIITRVPKITSSNTITNIIDNGIKSNIRIVVISPLNPDKQAEIEKVKMEWPNIITDNYNDCLKIHDEYIIIDVIPCSINNKKHQHLKDCTSLYTLKLDGNIVINSVDKLKCRVMRHQRCN